MINLKLGMTLKINFTFHNWHTKLCLLDSLFFNLLVNFYVKIYSTKGITQAFLMFNSCKKKIIILRYYLETRMHGYLRTVICKAGKPFSSVLLLLMQTWEAIQVHSIAAIILATSH